eukprot:gene13305-13434_t
MSRMSKADEVRPPPGAGKPRSRPVIITASLTAVTAAITGRRQQGLAAAMAE